MAVPRVPEGPWLEPKFTGKPWWTKENVVLVTGSNRGIGYKLLHELATYGFTCILTDIDDTEATMQALKQEGLGGSVHAHPLDITSSASVENLAKWVKEKFNRIDILINNAGVVREAVTPEDAEIVINVNFFGATKVIKGLLPLIKPGGRIINVTSRTGLYQRLGNEEAKRQFQDVENLTPEDVEKIASMYLEDCKKAKPEENGWIASLAFAPQYSESKMCLSAYTIAFAKSLQTQGKKVYTCAFCPGFTDTAMTRGKPMGEIFLAPVEVGADTGLWLALMPEDEFAKKNGKLFGERTEFAWTMVPWIDPLAPFLPRT